MNRKSYKIWLTVAAILLLCLVGCHKTRTRDTEPNTSAPITIREEEVTEQEELLVFFQGGGMLITEFASQNPELKFKYVSLEGQSTSIIDMINVHGYPDILIMPGNTNIEELIENEIIAPMDDYYHNDLNLDYDQYFPGVFSVGKIGESMYALPLSLNMSYMTIRESKWQQSKLSNLPEEYNFTDLLTAMEAEFDTVKEEGCLWFYEEESQSVDMMLDGDVVSVNGGEVQLDREALEQMIRILCLQEYNKGMELDKSKLYLGTSHPALNPAAFEGKYLAGCWGGDVKSAPQVGVMYAHSANRMQFGEETHVVWRPNSKKGEFSAGVQIMAMIGSESDQKEEAYDVIRRMMDMKIEHWTVPAKIEMDIETFCPVNRERAKELITRVDEDARENLECFNDGVEMGGLVVIPKEKLTDSLKAEIENYLDHITNVYRVDPALYDGVDAIIKRYMKKAYSGILLDDYGACCDEVMMQIEENTGG